jgi:hypothetical protein
VVYLRLASPLTAEARHALLTQLAKEIRPADKANKKAQQALQGGSPTSLAAVMVPNSRQRELAQQAQQQVGRLAV